MLTPTSVRDSLPCWATTLRSTVRLFRRTTKLYFCLLKVFTFVLPISTGSKPIKILGPNLFLPSSATVIVKWSSGVTSPCFIGLFTFIPICLPSSSGGGYHGYDESYGSPPYEGRRMGPPMRGRGGRSYGPSYGPPPPPPGEYGGHAESPVVMLYGLEPVKMNADRVFNIFCLYGNVERVSVLLTVNKGDVVTDTLLSY